MPVGDYVELHSLPEPALNGRLAVVVGEPNESGRLPIELSPGADGEPRMLVVDPSSLQLRSITELAKRLSPEDVNDAALESCSTC